MFLRDLRPEFFPSMNWESKSVREEIGSYENQLGESYMRHEADFKAGRYATQADSFNFGLEAFYYGFMLTGNVTALIDGKLTMEELLSHNRRFTEAGASDFEEKNARMKRSTEVLDIARHLRSKERRVAGAYWANHVYSDRFASQTLNTRNSQANDMIRFALEEGVDRVTGAVFFNYDLLITLITVRFTEDSAFTFKNPMMDSLLEATIQRLNPNSFLGLDSLTDDELANFNFVGILGPMYRIDLLLRKAQSLADAGDTLNIKRYLAIADTTDRFLSNRLKPLLDRWPYRSTYAPRQALIADLKTYVEKLAAKDSSAVKPNGEMLFRTADFRQAYQCYNCHRHSQATPASSSSY